MNEINIRAIKIKDRDWINNLMVERWGSQKVVVHGDTFFPADLPGFIAFQNEKPCGLVTFNIQDDTCEVITLDALISGQGIGTQLIESAKQKARSKGCKKLCLVTTNDNLNALAFYQKRDFRLTVLRAGAVDISRKDKPEIPLIGDNGIPIHDELELELDL